MGPPAAAADRDPEHAERGLAEEGGGGDHGEHGVSALVAECEAALASLPTDALRDALGEYDLERHASEIGKAREGLSAARRRRGAAKRAAGDAAKLWGERAEEAKRLLSELAMEGADANRENDDNTLEPILRRLSAAEKRVDAVTLVARGGSQRYYALSDGGSALPPATAAAGGSQAQGLAMGAADWEAGQVRFQGAF